VQSQITSPPKPPVSFDGRLDNRADLLRLFEGKLSRETCDAALVLAVYERWGTPGFVHLLGDWSLALWRASERAIVLASDFAGVRPLYYCIQQHRVVWSTRLGSLVDYVQADEIDDKFVAGFLTYGDCPNRTPYCNVYSVPPGQSVRVESGKITVQRFWEPPTSRAIRYPSESIYEEQLNSLFREAVRSRLRTHTPVIAELSGGLDSSSIVCMASDLIRRGEVEAPQIVTLSCEHRDSIDAPFYSAVEAHCGIKGIHVSASAFPYLTETHTGGASPSAWEHLYARSAAIASQIGANTYITGLLGDLTMGNWWDDSEQVAGPFGRGNIKQVFQQAFSWSKSARIPIYWILWKAFLTSLPSWLCPGGRVHLGGSGTANEDSIARGFKKRTGLNEPQSFFSQSWKHAMPERRKHVRALIETLELRRLQPPEPLQHLCYTHAYGHRPLVEFMLSIPADIVCRPGEPRRLMRKAFHDLWPRELQKRRSKDSFGGVFLDSVRPLAKTLPERPMEVVERGYIDRKHLQTRLKRLAQSLECNAPQLQQIILLELWLRGRRVRDSRADAPVKANAFCAGSISAV
jgi:asparagine synthase (glutamine-hydrolysing)